MNMRRAFSSLILLGLIASLIQPAYFVQAQSSVPSAKAQAVLDSMSPEERVGQLFLVTFQGVDTSPESQIHDLIANHHVGGVVLLAGNDNFVPAPNTVNGAHQLINTLQTIEWDASTGGQSQPGGTYVPLFVGVSQEGDGAPHDQILNGLTPMPDAMAVGATWKTDLAQQVGTVLGKELSALGFNLFIGPSLDVLESPDPAALSDLGTRVFGGDPFWVGEMGRSYIAGLHAGSNNHMVVVSKHFPGRGSSDRQPEEEVATVRKSLEQLKQIELFPFFLVTNSSDPATLTDGLLVSHIRYQGFQGNIRATTRPVGFDASALSAILALPQFASWRANGGLIVSDSLGSQAVRDFYSQGGEKFLPRNVARDAFIAGNDLLYLGNITSSDVDVDTYSATIQILDFFSQEYRNNSVFAQLIDAAVLRILTQKFRMYEIFTASNVLTPDEGLSVIGSSQQVAVDVARNAAALISPDPQELSTLLPSPPNQSDWIVFLSDVSTSQQCSTCPLSDAFAADALEKTVVRLYGPAGSGQISAGRVRSFPFTELELLLTGESQTTIDEALGRATWVVISLTDVSGGQISLLRRFFSERPNLIRNKNVILFSFTAPYYLDATDISKLTAYYALYSKQPAFVDVAARLLFQQVPLQGVSPVSIPAVGYDLITITSPDPAQVIPLELDQEIVIPPTATGEPLVTAEPTAVPSYRIGDTIAVRAGPILDRNGHVVPDNTPVRFTMSTRDESGGILKQVDTTTTDGISHASFLIDKPGKVQISVASDPAVTSSILQFDASDEGAVVVTVVVPEATATPAPITPTPTATPVSRMISPEGYPRIGVWFLVLLAIFGGAILSYWAVSRIVSPRWGVRWALCIFLGGLLAYNYLALGFPGAAGWVAEESGAFRVLMLTMIGEALGGVIAWIWMQWFSEPGSKEG